MVGLLWILVCSSGNMLSVLGLSRGKKIDLFEKRFNADLYGTLVAGRGPIVLFTSIVPEHSHVVDNTHAVYVMLTTIAVLEVKQSLYCRIMLVLLCLPYAGNVVRINAGSCALPAVLGCIICPTSNLAANLFPRNRCLTAYLQMPGLLTQAIDAALARAIVTKT